MAKQIRKEHLKELYEAILALETEEEAEEFFEDLCTPTELTAMEQRFMVASLLRQNKVYLEILKETSASTATISRVKRMLSTGNGVLQQVMDRVETQE